MLPRPPPPNESWWLYAVFMSLWWLAAATCPPPHPTSAGAAPDVQIYSDDALDRSVWDCDVIVCVLVLMLCLVWSVNIAAKKSTEYNINTLSCPKEPWASKSGGIVGAAVTRVASQAANGGCFSPSVEFFHWQIFSLSKKKSSCILHFWNGTILLLIYI